MNGLHSRIGVASVVLAGLLAIGASGGCNVGQEGERCNPKLSHDECGSGLSCQEPADCPENYCCPTTGTSSNPYCQQGCNGGQASICAAGGDAACWELVEGGQSPGADGGGDTSVE
jgi:hypothetical protein